MTKMPRLSELDALIDELTVDAHDDEESSPAFSSALRKHSRIPTSHGLSVSTFGHRRRSGT